MKGKFIGQYLFKFMLQEFTLGLMKNKRISPAVTIVSATF